jgi:hypothetical protein
MYGCVWVGDIARNDNKEKAKGKKKQTEKKVSDTENPKPRKSSFISLVRDTWLLVK